MSRRDLLERSANVAMIVAAAVFVAAQVRGLIGSGGAAPKAAAAAYAPGDEAPRLDGVEYGKAKRSVLVFVNSECHFCTASMPFYKSLMANRKVASTETIVMAVSRDSPKDLDAYIQQHGVGFDRLISMGREVNPRMRLTPTVFVVDGAGKIVKVFVGKLDEAMETELAKIVD